MKNQNTQINIYQIVKYPIQMNEKGVGNLPNCSKNN